MTVRATGTPTPLSKLTVDTPNSSGHFVGTIIAFYINQIHCQGLLSSAKEVIINHLTQRSDRINSDRGSTLTNRFINSPTIGGPAQINPHTALVLTAHRHTLRSCLREGTILHSIGKPTLFDCQCFCKGMGRTLCIPNGQTYLFFPSCGKPVGNSTTKVVNDTVTIKVPTIGCDRQHGFAIRLRHIWVIGTTGIKAHAQPAFHLAGKVGYWSGITLLV